MKTVTFEHVTPEFIFGVMLFNNMFENRILGSKGYVIAPYQRERGVNHDRNF